MLRGILDCTVSIDKGINFELAGEIDEENKQNSESSRDQIVFVCLCNYI